VKRLTYEEEMAVSQRGVASIRMKYVKNKQTRKSKLWAQKAAGEAGEKEISSLADIQRK